LTGSPCAHALPVAINVGCIYIVKMVHLHQVEVQKGLLCVLDEETVSTFPHQRWFPSLSSRSAFVGRLVQNTGGNWNDPSCWCRHGPPRDGAIPEHRTARVAGASPAPCLGHVQPLWSCVIVRRVIAHPCCSCLQVTPSGVAILRINCPGEKQNTLTTEMIGKLEEVVTRVETDAAIKAAVLISGKKARGVG
jgi:hypothetical protein